MLHDARIRRGEIKNKLDEIKYILGTQLRSDGLNNLEKTLDGVNNRKYSAGVIKEWLVYEIGGTSFGATYYGSSI